MFCSIWHQLSQNFNPVEQDFLYFVLKVAYLNNKFMMNLKYLFESLKQHVCHKVPTNNVSFHKYVLNTAIIQIFYSFNACMNQCMRVLKTEDEIKCTQYSVYEVVH